MLLWFISHMISKASYSEQLRSSSLSTTPVGSSWKPTIKFPVLSSPAILPPSRLSLLLPLSGVGMLIQLLVQLVSITNIASSVWVSSPFRQINSRDIFAVDCRITKTSHDIHIVNSNHFKCIASYWSITLCIF